MTEDPARVLTGVLTPSRLDDLLRDIGALGANIRVLVKGAARAYASEAAAELAVARRTLDAGDAVQIRYEVDGETWIDTLRPDPEGVRLVRCPLPEPPGEAPAD